MPEIKVTVQQDHLERLALCKNPVIGLEELIWNALDADSNSITVELSLNAIGGLQQIIVRDDGLGIPYPHALEYFKRLGGSWKKHTSRTQNEKRILHGKMGQGRFKAYSIGENVTWETTYSENSHYSSYTIYSSTTKLGWFNISEPSSTTTNQPGTTVTIDNLKEKTTKIDTQKAADELSETFALYLLEYPHVKIKFHDHLIDPSTFIAHRTNIQSQIINIDGREIQYELSIIEWTNNKDRSLCLCDQSGFVLLKKPLGVHTPGIRITVYLKSDYLRELSESGNLYIEDSHEGLKLLLTKAKESIKDYYRTRAAERSKGLIQEWKKLEIYPYSGEATNAIETIERQVFDVLALNVNEYLPSFSESETQSKKLSLSLIKEALERNPGGLHNILSNVIKLPKEKVEELDSLLKKTTLSKIISASKTVADRLDFISGLELLIYDYKKSLKERSQLHKILAENTWIFGEEFHLTLSDKSLNAVLQKHINILGRENVNPTTPVLRDDGSIGIVDLMLSRTTPQPRGDRHTHLIIELKRPSQKIDMNVLSQTQQYALAVSRDERFVNLDTEWVFWALSNEMSDDAKQMSQQVNRAEGIVFQAKNITVWSMPWSKVFESCKSRLRFFKEKLGYESDDESTLQHLHRLYNQYLPEELVNKQL